MYFDLLRNLDFLQTGILHIFHPKKIIFNQKKNKKKQENYHKNIKNIKAINNQEKYKHIFYKKLYHPTLSILSRRSHKSYSRNSKILFNKNQEEYKEKRVSLMKILMLPKIFRLFLRKC